MRRCHPIPLEKLLRAFLREEGLETPLNEYRAVELWPEVMGQAIMRYTGAVEFRHGRLYVQIKNPALRADLLMERTRLKERLNARIGSQTVSEVVIY